MRTRHALLLPPETLTKIENRPASCMLAPHSRCSCAGSTPLLCRCRDGGASCGVGQKRRPQSPGKPHHRLALTLHRHSSNAAHLLLPSLPLVPPGACRAVLPCTDASRRRALVRGPRARGGRQEGGPVQGLHGVHPAAAQEEAECVAAPPPAQHVSRPRSPLAPRLPPPSARAPWRLTRAPRPVRRVTCEPRRVRRVQWATSCCCRGSRTTCYRTWA